METDTEDVNEETVNEIDISKWLDIIENQKEELDEEDLEKIVNILTLFNLKEDFQKKLKAHLDILEGNKKKRTFGGPGQGNKKNSKFGGPGWGKTNEKQDIKELEDAVDKICNHKDKLSSEMLEMLLIDLLNESKLSSEVQFLY